MNDLLIADVNPEAILDDIAHDIVLCDFLPTSIKSLKECCVAAIKNYNEDKIFAKSPDMNKIRSHVAEVLNIGTIRKYNIHGYVSLIIKHRKRITNFDDELTGLTLLAISHIFGREIADTIFNNEISTDVLLFKKEYSDKQFWRYKLRKFEGTKHWFFLFKYLFIDCYNDDREPSFARTRKGKRQMMIYLSPEWHNRLNELHFFEMIKEPFENIIRRIDLLILSGDVELNPGPAIMSRLVRYNNSSTRHVHEAQVGVLNDISDLNKFLNSQLPIVVEQIRKIVDDCNLGFQSTVLLADSKLKEDIRLLTQVSGDAISKVEGIQSMILKTMLLCSLIILLRQMQWNRTALMAGVIGMLSLFGLPGKLIQLFQKAFCHESQNFGVDTVYGPLLGSIICYFIIGKLPTNSSLEQFSKKTNNISRGLSGMMNLNRDIGKLWLQVKDFVMAQISPLPDSFMSVEEELKVWSDSIEHYTDIIVKKQAMIKNVDIIKISGLLKQGIKLKKWAYANKCSTQMCLHIASMCRHAEQLYNFCDKNNTLDGGQRQRPLCIVLFGESQIGKSRLIYPLCQDLCYEAGFRKSTDIEEQIYARQPETEFWDGYKGQFIVVRDDCLAAVDDVSKPNPELHETIRELNDFPYHLHMAALEDKNTYYTSKVGIMTINDINSPIRSLSYPEAFFNRISDHMYEVVPHPDFAKTLDVGGGRTKTLLDQIKVAKHLDALSEIAGYRVPTSTEIYTFQKYRKQIISGKLQFVPDLTQPLLNYDAFSALMCSELSRKQDDFVIQKDFMNKRLEKKMVAQVNDDIYFECDTINADDASEFGDIIATGLHEGRSLIEIETEILESNRAEAYINFKGACQLVSSPISLKLKYYAANIFDNFKITINEFFNNCKDKIASVLDKYPALKYIFFIGTTAVGLYTVYKAFMQDETIDSFIVADSIDEETYLRNCKWIKQQTKMSVEENMSYWKTNLMMRNPEECNLIETNTSNIPIHTIEAYNSPGQGKDKKKPRHVIEAYNSPGQGKDKRKAKFVVETRVHESEGSNDINAIETSMHILRNNLYSLTYESKDGEKLLGNVMALKGFNFLMPYHFIQYMQLMELPLDTKLSLSRINYSEKVYNSMMSFTLSEIIHADGTLNRAVRLTQNEDELDAIIFCPSERSNIVCHRSILKHFILREEQCRLFGKMEGVLLSYSNDNGQVAKLIKTLKNVHSFDTPLPISVLGHEYIQRHGYLYEGNTMKGECGGPLIILANSLIRKIVGMHVSGMAGEGYSVKLNQEILEEHLGTLAAKIPDGHRSQCYVHIDENILRSNDCDIPPGVFPEIGKVKIPLYQCSKTVLRPSLIHGEITEPTTKPAHLRPFMKDGILINPAIKGLEKCGGITKLIDPNKCEMACNYIFQKVSRDYVDCGYEKYARVMTYEEAIMGNEDTFISAMCRSTSPGYPFNSDPQHKSRLPGKQAWMGKAEEFDFTSSKALELRSIVEQLRADCLKGIITNVICADTMKDERRPIAKVDEGKTRMFSACPMHFVTLFRQYYVGFAAFIMHNRNVNGIAVGTNVYSSDWDQIVRQIKLKGNKVLAGDFSNFDGSLITQVLWLVYDIIEEFYRLHDVNYSEDDQKIRYSLWIHIVNSIHIYGDNIYQWTHSQPSGNPFTVIINSIYNLLILCIAYFETVEDSDISEEEKAKLLNSMAYDKFVSPIVYGDDNILNIHDNIVDIFNQITLTKALKRLGHDYTEETKSGEVHKYRKLHEISFLKRNFKFCNDVSHYVAPLDINVIYEMMNWVRGNSVDPVHLLKDNIETALTEASLHGKEVYQTFVARLRKNNKVVTKVIPYIPTYGELRLRVEQFSPSDGFMA